MNSCFARHWSALRSHARRILSHASDWLSAHVRFLETMRQTKNANLTSFSSVLLGNSPLDANRLERRILWSATPLVADLVSETDLDGNSPPQLDRPIPDQTVDAADWLFLNLSGHFSDADWPDGDRLRYLADVDSTEITIGVSGRFLWAGVDALTEGSFEIQITAIDLQDASLSTSFLLHVNTDADGEVDDDDSPDVDDSDNELDEDRTSDEPDHNEPDHDDGGEASDDESNQDHEDETPDDHTPDEDSEDNEPTDDADESTIAHDEVGPQSGVIRDDRAFEDVENVELEGQPVSDTGSNTADLLDRLELRVIGWDVWRPDTVEQDGRLLDDSSASLEGQDLGSGASGEFSAEQLIEDWLVRSGILTFREGAFVLNVVGGFGEESVESDEQSAAEPSASPELAPPTTTSPESTSATETALRSTTVTRVLQQPTASRPFTKGLRARLIENHDDWDAPSDMIPAQLDDDQSQLLFARRRRLGGYSRYYETLDQWSDVMTLVPQAWMSAGVMVGTSAVTAGYLTWSTAQNRTVMWGSLLAAPAWKFLDPATIFHGSRPEDGESLEQLVQTRELKVGTRSDAGGSV